MKLKAMWVCVIAICAFGGFELQGQASSRVVMTERVVVGGEEQVRSFTCNSRTFLSDNNDCYDAETGELLGSYWDINPKMAEAVPGPLKGIMGIE